MTGRQTNLATKLGLDYEDGASGMMVGRTAAIADWQFRREQEDFEVVVNRLRVKKWHRENPTKRAAKARRYWTKPEVRARQLANAKRRRQERHRKRAESFTCAECEAQWCRVPWRRWTGPRPRFCTTACLFRNRYQQRTPGARRVKRTGNQP